MRVTLVFDNLGIQDIDRKHIVRLNFERLKRRLFYRLHLFNSNPIYECSVCDMVIDSKADQPTIPNVPINSNMIRTTVFQNISSNTISAIEVKDKYGKKTVFVPSKVENGKNQYQILHRDAENNLHIKCQRHGEAEDEGSIT